MPAAVYNGTFSREQAERLLWRAGFGPRRGEAEALAKLGLDGAVRKLTRPRAERFVGAAPHDDKGRALAPADAWGHDHIWWLDRMVRTSRPLVERLTLVWHDWFATSLAGVGSQRLMLNQNKLLRSRSLGSFETMLRELTRDPAMLLWLSGTENTKWSPNENFARELMELFTLGAGGGYSERDVREQARALTGFDSDWRRGIGSHNFRFERKRHDSGTKRIFGRSGAFDWEDAVRLCLRHPSHPSFFVEKLWGYFVPTPPDAATRRSLERLYRQDLQIRPVVEAILRHPALYTGPRMVKPPVVYTAGLLRGMGRGIDTTSWAWISNMAGQRLFMPPNVAGWDDDRWLDTATFRGRWTTANQAARVFSVTDKQAGSISGDPERLVDAAIAFWGSPTLRAETRAALLGFARRAMRDANQSWKRKSYPVLVTNALRQLVAVSPDLQTC
ncbi:MAG: DUF1800 domain-containing protein [Gaiellaceae bacterium MAG52_C11]|nr:DUF1800 domain-containing protein [Candidatus Gaiellasilicea maunaloa]